MFQIIGQQYKDIIHLLGKKQDKKSKTSSEIIANK